LFAPFAFQVGIEGLTYGWRRLWVQFPTQFLFEVTHFIADLNFFAQVT
jgi:hypothetical protein